MNFFLSAEAQAPAAGILAQLHRIADSELKVLSDKCYGKELESIAIISILVQEELYEDGGFPERKLFQRKQFSADIRLRIDFRAFLIASSEKRYKIYCEHVLSSIETLRHKVSTDFLFDELVCDVSKILYSRRVHDACVAIKRFP